MNGYELVGNNGAAMNQQYDMGLNSNMQSGMTVAPVQRQQVQMQQHQHQHPQMHQHTAPPPPMQPHNIHAHAHLHTRPQQSPAPQYRQNFHKRVPKRYDDSDSDDSDSDSDSNDYEYESKTSKFVHFYGIVAIIMLAVLIYYAHNIRKELLSMYEEF